MMLSVLYMLSDSMDTGDEDLERLLASLRRLLVDFPPAVISLKTLIEGDRVTEADKARVAQAMRKACETVLTRTMREHVEDDKVLEHFRFVVQ